MVPAAKVPNIGGSTDIIGTGGDQETVAEYWPERFVADVTGIAPVIGVVNPVIIGELIVVAGVAVAGNTAVTVPELASFDTKLAPDTVKKLDGTPVRV